MPVVNPLDRFNALIEHADRRHVTVFLACTALLMIVTCLGW
jgi:hypothetical protein